MNAHKKYVGVMKFLGTLAFCTLQYLFIPFGALSGVFAGLILYAIWSPFFSSESK
jgi:hypothetical protein